MTHDVAVVGAGPAGLAAASEAAGAGLDVVLVDAGERPGGQFWRHSGTAPRRARSTFLDLTRSLSALRYLPRTQVWLITRAAHGFTLQLTGAEPVAARSLILCPGGHDRQLPIPGWDLPGVMAAGGVQALLKEHGIRPGRRAVVAGTGPFLLSVAAELAHAGVTVAAVAEANPVTSWLRDPVGAFAVPGKSVEALGYAAAMARHRIPYRTRTVVTEILGDGRVEAVRLRGSKTTEIACDVVALGWGFTPSLELPLMLGAETRLDTDGSLVAVVDGLQRSTVEGLSIAGEATGVGGAALAVAEGRLAALALASGDPARIRRLQRSVRRGRRFAAALHRASPIPPSWPEWLTATTVVCRCEEVPYGDLVRACQDLGADDARTLKLLARPGMGWCQARMCGFATAHLAAHLTGTPVTAEGLQSLGSRMPAFPVPLSVLADIQADGGAGVD